MSAIYNNHPIGIFDSGVGGLSIAKSISALVPNESFIYLADSLNAPYGNLTSQQIKERVNKIAQWFIKQNAKAIVIACNTATVNAIDQLRTLVNIPIIGVEPGIKPAVEKSATHKIAIMVTQATATNERFINLVNSHKQNTDVIIQACPGLVEVVESDNIDSEHCTNLLKLYLTPLVNANIDTLVLGCTHYPFLSDQIQCVIGDTVTLVETATPVAKQLQRQLAMYQLSAHPDNVAQLLFYSTKISEQQEIIFSQLWEKKITLKKLAI
ncbi:glutamate racemase [Thalassotalea piscium]|uniref:Glutamate racemase n=1 Tax=Thalassotalea piscium TaxID=1230533 RepID=A0A7X0NIS7_9GAMM|nr:glutamate racemase [Thalassotalea piscium]MBB6544180.1 glutamate racemase [Thalassotalea piscium]